MANKEDFYMGDVTLIPRRISGRLGWAATAFLSELHQDLSHDMGIIHDGKQWVGRKSDAWAQYLDISSRTVTRIVKYMVELGMISVEKLSSHRSNRTNYYTINYDKLDFVLKTPKAKWVSGARYKQRKLF